MDQTPADEVKKPTPEQVIDGYLTNLMMFAVRGTIGMLGQVPANVLLVALCRAFGKVIASIYGGEADIVVAVRNDCRKAFENALRDAPVPELPVEKKEAA
jgi:hypothetical protein